jgi:hypothetical protein
MAAQAVKLFQESPQEYVRLVQALCTEGGVALIMADSGNELGQWVGLAKLNADGTFTVYYGSKEIFGDVTNRLDVTEGWNFLMRVYRPGPSVLDGSYTLPEVEPVK